MKTKESSHCWQRRT